jgi:hypothetical protein
MIGKRNSGKFQQDAVVGQFAKDARSQVGGAAVAAGLKQGKARTEYVASQPERVRMSFKFLATGK